MPSPDDFQGPDEFALAVFTKNEQDGAINKERFIGLGHCLFQAARSDGLSPENDVLQILRQMAGPLAESEKCQAAAVEIVDKIGSEVIPYVAGEVFDVLDRDRSKGVSKEEIDFAITAAMQGPTAAFGMFFRAIDKDGSGSLSSSELSEFFANIVRMGGKSALVFINVFAATFKDDLADGAVAEAFNQLDANEDGVIDKAELEDLLGALTMMKEQFGQVQEQVKMMGGPPAMLFELLTSTLGKWKAAGDLDHAAFFNLFEEVSNAQIDQMRALAANPEGLPVPPEMIEKFMPFVNTAIAAFQSAFKINMKAVTDAYFAILDSNNDGIIQNHELMAVVGLVDADTTAQQSFDALFGLIDTNGDGQISKEEAIIFIKKLFDLVVIAMKNAVEVYQAIINAVAAEFFKFFIQQIAGGDDLSADKFNEIAGAFAQDGPEVLLAPLMQ